MHGKHAAIHTMHVHVRVYTYTSHTIMHSGDPYASMCVVACMSDCIARLGMPRMHVV